MADRRVLVVATVPLVDNNVDWALDTEGAIVQVVAPASKLSPLDWLTNDEGAAREQAEASAEQTVEAVADDVVIKSEVGDVDPLQAAEDKLRTFAADELVVVVSPESEASWLERSSMEDGFERFGLPVRYVVSRETGGT